MPVIVPAGERREGPPPGASTSSNADNACWPREGISFQRRPSQEPKSKFGRAAHAPKGEASNQDDARRRDPSSVR